MRERPWCWRCFWIGLTAFGLLGWWTIYRSGASAEKLETKLTRAASAAMAEAWALESPSVDLRGSHLHIRGRAKSEGDRAAAFAAVVAATEEAHGLPGVFAGYVNEIEVPTNPGPDVSAQLVPKTAIAETPTELQIAVNTCQIDFDRVLEGKQIRFKAAGAVISPESYSLLDEVAAVVKTCERFTIEIGGHTDPSGNGNDNLTLGLDRATAVLEYLGSKGVSTTRLKAIDYGESRQVDRSDSPDGLARNQWIEFRISAGN